MERHLTHYWLGVVEGKSLDVLWKDQTVHYENVLEYINGQNRNKRPCYETFMTG